MFFNSVDYAIFLPIVFTIYWLLKNRLNLQNIFLVCASYFFYGCWNWKFLALILISTIVDYFVALKIYSEKERTRQKLFLSVSIIVNIGILAYFKYANFFIDSFTDAFSLFGLNFNVNSLKIILPVGISFYTFQTLSYTIDVYRKQLRPTNKFIEFAAFVSFFPQLVAGPIERASNLLPQFYTKKEFEYDKAADGLRQILWGLFKKVVIADNCAIISNQIFNNSAEYHGITLILGAMFFAFQIYGDFSGYSDIAIGTAKLFGFDLMQNFAFPYFSRDIAEFWRRWHISLSTWFRDYLYIPLGGSRGGNGNKIRNTFIIFIVSGLWHGANWTFIAWGFLNALYFLPIMLLKRNRVNLNMTARDRLLPSFVEFIQIISTFMLTSFAWIFFRAESLGHAFSYIRNIFVIPSGYKTFLPGGGTSFKTLMIVALFILVEWLGRDWKYAIEWLGEKKQVSLRWASYCFALLFIYFFGNFFESVEFIYFQF